jgi:phosphoserine aminotransferase
MPSLPLEKPSNPCFASGPAAKRPGWSVDVLKNALVGRSHRSMSGLARIREMLMRMRHILEIPADYHLALVGGSATGAVEMALWNFLGARGVDSLAWDIFSHRWQYQLRYSLKLTNLRCLNAPEGQLPDLQQVDFDHDVVFLWNGSTAGVRVPDGEWIPADRRGLTLCDATSAVFAMRLPWEKLDVTAFSWQKGLGSEAAHGMLALSPRAVERLESYQPAWPIPGLYRLRENGKFHQTLFDGVTTNTPSLLCLEDCLDALKWAERIGGLPTLIKRSEANLQAIRDGLIHYSWLTFLAEQPSTCSSSTICLRLKECLPKEEAWALILKVSRQLAELGIAYECSNHSSATPAFRLWGGPTVEAEDLKRLLPWLNWAWQQA